MTDPVAPASAEDVRQIKEDLARGFHIGPFRVSSLIAWGEAAERDAAFWRLKCAEADGEVEAAESRAAQAEAALERLVAWREPIAVERLVAWREPIAVCAPELGAALAAFDVAIALLAARAAKDDAPGSPAAAAPTCWNCGDTPVPPGCEGTFAGQDQFCLLNRERPHPFVPLPRHSDNCARCGAAKNDTVHAVTTEAQQVPAGPAPPAADKGGERHPFVFLDNDMCGHFWTEGGIFCALPRNHPVHGGE